MKRGDMVKLTEGCIKQCNLSPEWDNKVGIVIKVERGIGIETIDGWLAYTVAWPDKVTIEDKWDMEVVSLSNGRGANRGFQVGWGNQ